MTYICLGNYKYVSQLARFDATAGLRAASKALLKSAAGTLPEATEAEPRKTSKQTPDVGGINPSGGYKFKVHPPAKNGGLPMGIMIWSIKMLILTHKHSDFICKTLILMEVRKVFVCNHYGFIAV